MSTPRPYSPSMRIQANQFVVQAQKNAFMETFSRALSEEEEDRLYEKAFDTFYEQGGVDEVGSLDGVPPILAAHTFKEAKASLTELMPKAGLSEIREASEEHPEVAKWVRLLDTSSQYLKGVAEQAPTTLTPEPWIAAPVASRVPTSTAPSTSTVVEETQSQDIGQAWGLLSEAASLSERARSGYSGAEAEASQAESSLNSSTSGLSYTEEREVGLAIIDGGQSAESSGRSAQGSAELAMGSSSNAEQVIGEALNLLGEHHVADDLRRLIDSCIQAREHGQDGIADLEEASSSLHSAMNSASYLAEAPEEAQLAMEAISAVSAADDSGGAYGDGADDFQDAAREQQRVSEGLQGILSTPPPNPTV